LRRIRDDDSLGEATQKYLGAAEGKSQLEV